MRLEAGRYYIGDPCYTFSDKEHDLWIEFLDGCNWGRDGTGLSEYKGHRFFTAGTAWGDGTYVLDGPGTYKHLGVDAGMLAIMPEALADGVSEAHSDIWGEDGDGLYAFVDFPESFDVDYDNGVFRFGDFVIDTYGDEGDDDDGDERFGSGYDEEDED